MVDTSMDSKWRFYYRLRKFFRTCYVADSRVNAQYERGWNDDDVAGIVRAAMQNLGVGEAND